MGPRAQGLIAAEQHSAPTRAAAIHRRRTVISRPWATRAGGRLPALALGRRLQKAPIALRVPSSANRELKLLRRGLHGRERTLRSREHVDGVDLVHFSLRSLRNGSLLIQLLRLPPRYARLGYGRRARFGAFGQRRARHCNQRRDHYHSSPHVDHLSLVDARAAPFGSRELARPVVVAGGPMKTVPDGRRIAVGLGLASGARAAASGSCGPRSAFIRLVAFATWRETEGSA